MVVHNIIQTVAPTSTTPEVRRRSVSDRGGGAGRAGNIFGLNAAQLIVSIGGDADIVADWIFYSKSKEKEFLPQWVIRLQLVFCIVATILWLIQVTDGRLAKPFLNRCNLTLSNKYIMALGVLLEDVPQIVLSFLIDNVYGTGITPEATANIMSSAYDLYMKVVAVLTGETGDEEEAGEEQEGLVEGGKEETYGSTA